MIRRRADSKRFNKRVTDQWLFNASNWRSRRLGPLYLVAMLFLLLMSTCLIGCEAVGEAAGEGLAGGEAGVARAGAAEGTLARGTAAGEAGLAARTVIEVEPEIQTALARTDVVEPPVEKMEARGTTDWAIRRTGLNFGSEPLEGWAKHFDQNGNYKGYSYFTQSEVRHYDQLGNFDGKEVRVNGGSQVYNADLAYKGRTTTQAARTLAYDEHGAYKGYSERIGNRINAYDANNRYSGSSTIHPLPNGFSLPPIPLVSRTDRPRQRFVVTAFRLFPVYGQVPSPEQRSFMNVAHWNIPAVFYLQVDGSIPGGASQDFDVPYTYVVSEDGHPPLRGSFNQHIQRGWQSCWTFQSAFKMDASDANNIIYVDLYSGQRKVARSSLRVLP